MASPKRFAAIAAVYQAVRVAIRPGGPSLGERAGAFPRLVRAAITGEYTAISKGRLALLVAALAYIVSPLDLIPEFVLLAGLADDALVMAWLATQFVEETEAFLEWELAQVSPAYAASSGHAFPGGSSSTSHTVRGDVIR